MAGSYAIKGWEKVVVLPPMGVKTEALLQAARRSVERVRAVGQPVEIEPREGQAFAGEVRH